MKIKATIPQQEIEIDIDVPPVPAPQPEPRRLFSPESFWNAKLTDPTAHFNSFGMVSELMAQTKNPPFYAPGINTVTYSTPLYIIKDATPKIKVEVIDKTGTKLTFTKLWGQLQTGVPMPEKVIVAGGTDGHCTIWDHISDTLYEFWGLKQVNGSWQCKWGAVIYNVSNDNGIIEPIKNSVGGIEEQGATATSLPVIGGVMLLTELERGQIGHCLAMAIPHGPNRWVWPAQRTDKGVAFFDGPNAIPAGQRFFFPKDIMIQDSWPPILKMMVEAIRDYGCVVRDRSGNVTFYAEDTRQYDGTNQITQFMGGKPHYEVMKMFPWNQLKALG